MIGFSTHHFFNFENAWVIFILLDCTENWISNIGVRYIIVYLRLDTILLKNVLNVSASSSLLVIALLLSFNVMHSLWKASSEKRGLIVFQNFLLSVTILLFKFPKQSLLFLRKILTQRFLCFIFVDFYVKKGRP